MVAKEVLNIQYDASDRTQLPFFSLTDGASQYFYFCRRFSLEDGGDVVVITKSESGTCTARLYFTGPIVLDDEEIGLGDYPFTTDFSAKFGFLPNAKASEIDDGTWQKIIEVMDSERDEAYKSRNITPETFDRALAARAPLIDTEFPIASPIFERLLRLSIQPHLPERRDGIIAQEVSRVVAFDGTRLCDFISDRDVPTWRKVGHTVDEIAMRANPSLFPRYPWFTAANLSRELWELFDLCLGLVWPWRR